MVQFQEGERVVVSLYDNQGYKTKLIGTKTATVLGMSKVQVWVRYDDEPDRKRRVHPKFVERLPA